MKYSSNRRANRVYASSATKLDAVERRFARLFDAISYAHPIIKFRLWIAGLSGDSVVAPAPSEVIDAIVSKAMGGLVDWGGGVTDIQCPDRFEIQVPVSAWRTYYGHGTAEICTRIEGAVQAKLHRKLGCDLSPRVTICPTMALLDGELIVKSFYFDTLDEQADVRDEVVGDAPVVAGNVAVAAGDASVAVGNVPVGVDPEDVFDGEAVVEDTVEAGTTPVIGTAPMAERDSLEAPALTPRLMTEALAGTLAFGRKRYPLRDGMTVGVKRGDGSDQADIMLPYSEDFYLVSRRHGRLAYDTTQEVWRFEQLGSNGTTVVRDGRIVATLERGDLVVLHDGDGLLFAGARQQVSFLLSSESRTVCLDAA